jgi:diaminohydroxyphosphoribosylaminopyrimidine deaminase/5-amino-6-(5-phosphoribosylamino)uracil reductase
MVGAVFVRDAIIIGRGWHHRAGEPHAEIEALRDAAAKRQTARGAVLYVTLEPCSTHGRTPPCVDAIIAAGIKKVVVAATDPNPAHSGRGFEILRRAGIEVESGILANSATELNETFNHWIVHRRPFVTLKAGMTLDGKIATPEGESKWITSPLARAEGMKLRGRHDAILAGIETVLKDDPSLTWRPGTGVRSNARPPLRRVILDSRARLPLHSKVASDELKAATTVFVTAAAPQTRVKALGRHVRVEVAPEKEGRVDIGWILNRLGGENVTSLLVEGGGEVHGAFVDAGLAQRVVFFYAPIILGGSRARPAVGGRGVPSLGVAPRLERIRWKRLGPDLMLTARIRPGEPA